MISLQQEKKAENDRRILIMKKIITRVCALCLAASMVFPSGQTMAGEIQREVPKENAVYSEVSQNELSEGSSESTNPKNGKDDPERSPEHTDGDGQQLSGGSDKNEAEGDKQESPADSGNPEIKDGEQPPEATKETTTPSEPDRQEKGKKESRGKDKEQESDAISSDGIEKEALNLAAADGRKDDFYATVNAGILSKHPEDNWSYFEDLDNKAHAQERKIVQEAGKMVKAQKAERSSSEYKIGSLYNLAMNQKGRNKYSVKEYNRLMKPVMKAKTVKSFLDACAKLQKEYGLDGILNTEVVPDEYGNSGKYALRLNDLNYCIDPEEFQYKDKDAEADNKAYFDSYIKKLYVLSGKTGKEAKRASRQVYKFVKTVAKARKPGKYSEITVGKLAKKAPKLHIKRYLKKIYGKAPKSIYVTETATLKKINKYLTKKNLPLLKNYVYIVNLKELSPYMTSKMAKANQKIDEDYIGGSTKKSRKTIAAEQVASLLKWDVADIYTRKNFDNEEKAAIQELVNTLIQEYETMIREEDWITAATKEKAVNKLRKISVRTGMPQNAADYLSGYSPKKGKKGRSYLSNVLAIRKEAIQKKNRRLDKTIDRDFWETLPQEMNPCYYPTSNAIYIPVAALEAPYFSAKASREENFGAIGAILGHEITHAFDDLGSQYDEIGRFGDWWAPEDRKAFNRRAEKIVTYYNNYKTPGAMEVDGKQTLGENIADLGAMRCVSRIVEREKLSAEKFFESFANVWASKIDDLSAAMTSGMDEHAPDKVRVNAVLSSTELFYKVYGIREGDGMYVKPENRAVLW